MNKYEDLNRLNNNIKTMGERLEEHLNNKDKSKTYKELLHRMYTNYIFLRNERHDTEKKIKYDKENLSSARVAENEKSYNEGYNETCKTIKKATLEEINNLTESKRNGVKKMLSTAPTEEQARLLTVLQMRDDLNSTELYNIIPCLFGNYQGMKALETIGKKNGISVILPPQLDVNKMLDAIDKADTYLKEACSQISTPWSKLDIKYHAFFTEDPEHKDVIQDPIYKDLAETLDGVPQLRDVKTTKTQLTPSEKARIDLYFKDVSGLNKNIESDSIRILQHTKSVIEAHPEDIKLLKMSEYSSFVSDVENMQKDSNE